MRAKSSIIVIMSVLIIGGSPILAQERTSKELKPRKGVMMRSAMMGPEFLHDHMNSMIRQMSTMGAMMSRVMKSGKMDAETMKLMSKS